METIDKIKAASKIEDILNVLNFKDEYLNIVKEIHPDICKDKDATFAIQKLNELKNKFDNGIVLSDETGTFKTNGYWADFKSDEPCLDWSFDNYKRFKTLKDKSSLVFSKYIPSDSLILPDKTHRFIFDKRAVPLSGITLPQEHVNWILNRFLEYCSYLTEQTFVHCGLTPESVFIVPETHAIQVCSFYHLTRIASKVKTISGKYKNWYPAQLFTEKLACPLIDIEMAKKIAIYLLGDTSGSGIKLRKTHNPKFIDFVVKQHTSAHEAWTEYRELLKNNFEKKFHSLNI